MSLVVQPGADHFHGSPEVSRYVALFIRKTAEYRLPEQLPPGDAVVSCRRLEAGDGWLVDPDLYRPTHPPAPYGTYTGKRMEALWHYDGETAEATVLLTSKIVKFLTKLSSGVGVKLLQRYVL
jgi:hypothetical protein